MKTKPGFYIIVAIWLGFLPPQTSIGQTDWCAGVAGGPPGSHSTVIDLSLAHAQIRFFSPENRYLLVDQALVSAMPASGSLEAALSGNLLHTYADQLQSVCPVNADNRSLPAAFVAMSGTTAVIHPGTGLVTIPSEAKAIAIDLRNLPDAPGVLDAIKSAVSLAIASPFNMPNFRVRRHQGMTDEVFSATNTYVNSVVELTQPAIPAAGVQSLPLAFLTGDVMTPAAAEIAGAMRLGRKAVIIGKGIQASVAESRFHGIGTQGLSFRTEDLYSGFRRWPDVIRADVETDTPETYLPRIPVLYPPPPVLVFDATRSQIQPVAPFGDTQPDNATLKEMLAALVVTHGALRAFFPYFATVGDHIDDRLLETVNTAEQTGAFSRLSFRNLLRRFGESITDGHNFVFNFGTSITVGVFPVNIDNVANEMVIRRSLAAGVNPGDTIISVDGQSAAEWFASEAARSGGATPGYKFNIVTRELTNMENASAIGLRGLDGSTRTVTVVPYPTSTDPGFALSLREAGPLSDLGAPELYYINLDGDVLQTPQEFYSALRDAQAASGLVLDMRGYPAVNHYDVAQRINCTTFYSPIFRVPVLTGLDQYEILESQYTEMPREHASYCGRVVLLVAPITVSAAENFSTMLVDADRVTVVGRQSAGTNGNITGIQLPGAFGLSFTGMEVLHTDRSTFHGIGILPDVVAAPQAADFPANVDRELNQAIQILKQAGPARK